MDHGALEVVLRDAIVGLSALVAGIGIYLGIVNLNQWRRGLGAGKFYAALRFGTAIVVVLVGEAVARIAFVTAVWRTWLYLIGLVLIIWGGIGVGLYYRRNPDHP